MAKTQTFGDKTKKKKAADVVNIKVIKGVASHRNSSLRFLESYIQVNDVAEIEKMDFTK